jgi:hypothetical protein
MSPTREGSMPMSCLAALRVAMRSSSDEHLEKPPLRALPSAVRLAQVTTMSSACLAVRRSTRELPVEGLRWPPMVLMRDAIFAESEKRDEMGE